MEKILLMFRTKRRMNRFVKCLWWHHPRKSRSLLRPLIRYVLLHDVFTVNCQVKSSIVFHNTDYTNFCLHSLQSNCFTTEATINTHIPGESSSQDVTLQRRKIGWKVMSWTFFSPLQQFWWQHAEKYWVVWQAVIAVQWSRTIHQRCDWGWDLLLVILWPGP